MGQAWHQASRHECIKALAVLHPLQIAAAAQAQNDGFERLQMINAAAREIAKRLTETKE